MKLRPRLFRYNGLGETVDDGRCYVGLLAQEVPPALVPHCRSTTQVLMHRDDATLTEVYMLDLSCLPFVCLNALQQHEHAIQRIQLANWAASRAGATTSVAVVVDAPDDETVSDTKDETAAFLDRPHTAYVSRFATANRESIQCILVQIFLAVVVTGTTLLLKIIMLNENGAINPAFGVMPQCMFVYLAAMAVVGCSKASHVIHVVFGGLLCCALVWDATCPLAELRKTMLGVSQDMPSICILSASIGSWFG